jgi:DNA polymerase III delta subunit
MIISLSGDDKVKINNFILDFKSKYSKDSHVYVLDKNSDIKLSNLIESQGLFVQKKLIIISNPKAHLEFEDEKFFETTANSSDVHIVIDLSGLNGNLKIFKEIKKNSKFYAFDVPRDYTIFNLCDALFLKRNKEEALKIIYSIEDLEEKYLLILATIQSSLRNFLALKYKSKSANSIHPFIAKKIAMYKLNINEIQDMYNKLVELDLKSKTQKVDKRALLIDFVLYFF